MIRKKWNRSIREIHQKKSGQEISKFQDYKIARIRPRKRKPKHLGYTIMPEHKLWIFERNK